MGKKLLVLSALSLALTVTQACFWGGDQPDTQFGETRETRDSDSPPDDQRPANNAEGKDADSAADGNNGSQQDNDDQGNRNGERQTAPYQPLVEASKAEEYQRRCQFWALENLTPLEYQEFIELDPASMDDLDRILWSRKLQREGWRYEYDEENSPYQAPYCQEYWTEPLSSRNAHLRNHRYEDDCRNYLGQNVANAYRRLTEEANNSLANQGDPEDINLVFQTPNQYVRLLKWLDLKGDDLLMMENPPYRIVREQGRLPYAYRNGQYGAPSKREITEYDEQNVIPLNLEWLGIISAAGLNDGPQACDRFYPQLFHGYWIPIDTDGYSGDDQDNEPEPPRYDAATMPLYLPHTTMDKRVPMGYPLGQAADNRYYTCNGSYEAEVSGYYYVQHPAGDYCEQMP